MNKKTILAYVLIGLVIIAFFNIFGEILHLFLLGLIANNFMI